MAPPYMKQNGMAASRTDEVPGAMPSQALAGMEEMGGEEPGEYQDQDEGGAKVGGSPGPGVKVVGQNVPETECLMKFPLNGPFWFRPPKQGQA